MKRKTSVPCMMSSLNVNYLFETGSKRKRIWSGPTHKHTLFSASHTISLQGPRKAEETHKHPPAGRFCCANRLYGPARSQEYHKRGLLDPLPWEFQWFIRDRPPYCLPRGGSQDLLARQGKKGSEGLHPTQKDLLCPAQPSNFKKLGKNRGKWGHLQDHPETGPRIEILFAGQKERGLEPLTTPFSQKMWAQTTIFWGGSELGVLDGGPKNGSGWHGWKGHVLNPTPRPPDIGFRAQAGTSTACFLHQGPKCGG